MEKRQHDSLDDIVFENKNKAYGAYYNRLTAGFDLMKSLLITVFGVGILALVLSFTANKEDKTPEPKKVDVILDGTVVNPPKKDDKKIEPVKKDEPAPKTKTIKSDKTDIIPTPKDDVEKQTAMQNNEELSKVNIGKEDIDGDENTGIKTPQTGGEENGQGNGGDDSGTEEPVKENNTIYTARKVTQMAIFPGCEKFASNKEKLQTCLSEQLQNELVGQLADFNDTANRQGISEAVAKVQFVIDKSGKIVEVKTLNGGNVLLSKESKEALERISKRMIQKGKYIKPAKLEDGTPVNLVFTIPVKFISN